GSHRGFELNHVHNGNTINGAKVSRWFCFTPGYCDSNRLSWRKRCRGGGHMPSIFQAPEIQDRPSRNAEYSEPRFKGPSSSVFFLSCSAWTIGVVFSIVFA